MTPRGTTLFSKVQDLIDPVSGAWDEELIRSIFWPVDAQQILSIPLSLYGGAEDVVAWRYRKHVCFPVRSAYHMEWDYQFGRKKVRADGRGRSDLNPIWDCLWKCAVPAKVKIFARKTLHGVLPCYGVLANRHIPISAQCPICNLHCEDIMHTLFQCEKARELWKLVGLERLVADATETDRERGVQFLNT